MATSGSVRRTLLRWRCPIRCSGSADGQRAAFFPKLLRPALAQIVASGGDQRSNHVGRDVLGHRHQRDFAGRAARSVAASAIAGGPGLRSRRCYSVIVTYCALTARCTSGAAVPVGPVRPAGNGNNVQVLDDRRVEPAKQIDLVLLQGTGELGGGQGIGGPLLVYLRSAASRDSAHAIRCSAGRAGGQFAAKGNRAVLVDETAGRCNARPTFSHVCWRRRLRWRLRQTGALGDGPFHAARYSSRPRPAPTGSRPPRLQDSAAGGRNDLDGEFRPSTQATWSTSAQSSRRRLPRR